MVSQEQPLGAENSQITMAELYRSFEALREEMRSANAQTNQRIDDLRTDTNQRSDDLRMDTDKRFDDLRADMLIGQAWMRWGFGLMLALLVAMLSALLSGAF